VNYQFAACQAYEELGQSLKVFAQLYALTNLIKNNKNDKLFEYRGCSSLVLQPKPAGVTKAA
jgi:hypothetical protein